MALSVTVVVAFTITYITRSGLAQLKINPSELQLSDGIASSPVEITCTAPPGVTLYEISLTRFTPQVGRKLVSAVPGVNQGQAVIQPYTDLTQNNAKLMGGIEQRFIELRLTQAKCDDAGFYVCSITYSNATGGYPYTQILSYNQNLTFTVASGNITTSLSPNLELYAVNDTVKLECSAIVGNYQSGTWNWIWEYYDASSMAWRQYLPTDLVGLENFDQVPGTCTYRQACYLVHHLKAEDSQKKYRCTLQKNNDKESAYITIGTVSPDAYRPPLPDYSRYMATPTPFVNTPNTCTCTCIFTCPPS